MKMSVALSQPAPYVRQTLLVSRKQTSRPAWSARADRSGRHDSALPRGHPRPCMIGSAPLRAESPSAAHAQLSADRAIGPWDRTHLRPSGRQERGTRPGSDDRGHRAEQVLIATGRQPNSDGMGWSHGASNWPATAGSSSMIISRPRPPASIRRGTSPGATSSSIWRPMARSWRRAMPSAAMNIAMTTAPCRRWCSATRRSPASV